MSKLTPKERQIIALSDLTNAEIGVRLGITSRTVETHLYNIARKTGLDRYKLLPASSDCKIDLSQVTDFEKDLIKDLHLT